MSEATAPTVPPPEAPAPGAAARSSAAYGPWLADRARPMLLFVYGAGGLIPLAYLLGDLLIETATPGVWPWRVSYLAFWAVLSWFTFVARRPLPVRLSYSLYTLVGLTFACIIDGWLLSRPEYIIATSLLYLIGLVIALQGMGLTALCGLITVLVPLALLPMLGTPDATVQRIVLFHGIWAFVASVAAFSIGRLNHQLHASEQALREALQTEQRLRGQAEALARTDPLTGLLNRRELWRLGTQAIEQARRYGQPLSLLLVDVDHFKPVNDQHGHASGDAVIVELAGLCQRQLRAADAAARIGGEEFALLLPQTTLAQAQGLAERLRQRVQAHAITVQGLSGSAQLQMTVSVGCAQWQPAMPGLDALIAAADVALYEAKRGGRNRVMPAVADRAVEPRC